MKFKIWTLLCFSIFNLSCSQEKIKYLQSPESKKEGGLISGGGDLFEVSVSEFEVIVKSASKKAAIFLAHLTNPRTQVPNELKPLIQSLVQRLSQTPENFWELLGQVHTQKHGMSPPFSQFKKEESNPIYDPFLFAEIIYFFTPIEIQKNECSSNKEHKDASVEDHKLFSKICLSYSRISKVPREKLESEIVGLLVHEYLHTLGFNEEFSYQIHSLALQNYSLIPSNFSLVGNIFDNRKERVFYEFDYFFERLNMNLKIKNHINACQLVVQSKGMVDYYSKVHSEFLNSDLEDYLQDFYHSRLKQFISMLKKVSKFDSCIFANPVQLQQEEESSLVQIASESLKLYKFIRQEFESYEFNLKYSTLFIEPVLEVVFKVKYSISKVLLDHFDDLPSEVKAKLLIQVPNSMTASEYLTSKVFYKTLSFNFKTRNNCQDFEFKISRTLDICHPVYPRPDAELIEQRVFNEFLSHLEKDWDIPLKKSFLDILKNKNYSSDSFALRFYGSSVFKIASSQTDIFSFDFLGLFSIDLFSDSESSMSSSAQVLLNLNYSRSNIFFVSSNSKAKDWSTEFQSLEKEFSLGFGNLPNQDVVKPLLKEFVHKTYFIQQSD